MIRNQTPLVVARERGHLSVATLCLDRGADFDRAGVFGKTPLIVTCEHRQCSVDIVLLLLDRARPTTRA